MRNVLLLIAFVTFGCFGAVTTDILKAKGARLTVEDSTYFMAGIGMLRLSTPLVKIDSLYDWLKIGDSLYIGRPGTSTAKKSLTFRNGGFAEPGAYLTASNGDKIIFYRNAVDQYEGVMGIGSQANLWFKSVTPASGIGGKIEFYVDSACAVPKMRIKSDSVIIYKPLKVDGSITAIGFSLSGSTNTGSFACTTKTDDFTVQAIGTAYWQKIGNVFTCSFPSMSGTSNSATFKVYCRIPYYPMQEIIDKADKTLVQVYDDGAMTTGVIVIDKGLPNYVTIYKVPGTFTASGTKAFGPSTVDYFTEN